MGKETQKEGDNVNAKEFLQQYLDVDREINAKLDQIHHYRDMAIKTTQVLTPDRVQTSVVNKTEIIVQKIVDLEREVDADVDRLLVIKRQVEAVIASVPDSKQRAVLSRRYINGQTWEKIAVALDISYQWVCELHGRALVEVIKKHTAVDRS